MNTQGTTENMFISPFEYDDGSNAYDTFAKLNIMTDAHDNPSLDMPQLMFTLKGDDKSWNGDRLMFQYSSGSNASFFKITEITGSMRNKINFELFGSNNTYYGGSTYKTSNNSFIFSENNNVSENGKNNNFINADSNTFISFTTMNMNFIDSNDNTTLSAKTEIGGLTASGAVDNISFYHSDGNRIKGVPTFVNSRHQMAASQFDNNLNVTGYNYNLSTFETLSGGWIKGKSFINSKYNRCYGTNDYLAKDVFINSNTGLYLENFGNQNNIVIGNDLGMIVNCSGNSIEIGKGLINLSANNDKIILGYFNENSNDEDEFLIVGDGFLSQNYLDSLVANNGQWLTNDSQFMNVMTSISSNSNEHGYMENIYRHNIFTVNKQGYITISDFYNPTYSARYGVSGISAFTGTNNPIIIDYETLYKNLNADNTIKMAEETLKDLEEEVNEAVSNTPKNVFVQITGGNNHDYNNILLNYNSDTSATLDETLTYSARLDNNVTENSLLCLTNAQTIPIVVWWAYTKLNERYWNWSSATLDSYMSYNFLKLSETQQLYGYTLIKDNG